MKAYQCDICGRYYTDAQIQKGKKADPISGAELSFAPSRIDFKNDDLTKTTMHHDICQDCVDRFRKLVYSTREESGFKP